MRSPIVSGGMTPMVRLCPPEN
jgi:hypothetical protein